GLREAIAHRGVQWLALAPVAIELCGIGAKFCHIAPLEQGPDFAREVVDVILATKGGISPGDTGQYHVGTITEGNLSILQFQHHRNDRGWLDDPLKTGRQGPAVEKKTVLLGPRLNAQEVAVHVARPPHRAYDGFHAHVVASLQVRVRPGRSRHREKPSLAAHPAQLMLRHGNLAAPRTIARRPAEKAQKAQKARRGGRLCACQATVRPTFADPRGKSTRRLSIRGALAGSKIGW